MAIAILKEISDAEQAIETGRVQAEKKAQDMVAKASQEGKRKIGEARQEILQREQKDAQSIRKDIDAQKEKILKKAEQQARKLEENALAARNDAVQHVYDEFLNSLS